MVLSSCLIVELASAHLPRGCQWPATPPAPSLKSEAGDEPSTSCVSDHAWGINMVAYDKYDKKMGI